MAVAWSHTSDHVVIVYGSGNVLLHITFAVLTPVTCGLFLFPWIVWANTICERRVTLQVDPHGNIIRSRFQRLASKLTSVLSKSTERVFSSRNVRLLLLFHRLLDFLHADLAHRLPE